MKYSFYIILNNKKLVRKSTNPGLCYVIDCIEYNIIIILSLCTLRINRTLRPLSKIWNIIIIFFAKMFEKSLFTILLKDRNSSLKLKLLFHFLMFTMLLFLFPISQNLRIIIQLARYNFFLFGNKARVIILFTQGVLYRQYLVKNILEYAKP